MPQFLRAIALAMAMLTAHVTQVLPHAAGYAHRLHHTRPDARSATVAVGRLRRLEAQIALESPPPPPPAPLSIPAIIQQAFAPLGQAAVAWGQRVAMCESTYNPHAYNPSGAQGLFQFMPATWATTPYSASSVWDPVANARAAAWLYARDGAAPWTCG